jgi:C-terminal processing protease CtpA/Prc
MLTVNEFKLEGTDKQIAWIKLKSLSHQRLGVATNKAFVAEWNRVLAKALTSDGIILDLQNNGGGALTLAMLVAQCFLVEPAQIYTQERTQYSLLGPLLTFNKNVFLETNWPPRPDVEHRPLVVLVNAATGSAAEHLARVLQSHAGALVVGEPTFGIDAGIELVEGPDGSTLRFGSKSVLSTRGKSFQDVGVVPDISIKIDVSDLRRLGYSAWFSELGKVHKREVRRAFKFLWQRQSRSTAQPTGNKGG